MYAGNPLYVYVRPLIRRKANLYVQNPLYDYTIPLTRHEVHMYAEYPLYLYTWSLIRHETNNSYETHNETSWQLFSNLIYFFPFNLVRNRPVPGINLVVRN